RLLAGYLSRSPRTELRPLPLLDALPIWAASEIAAAVACRGDSASHLRYVDGDAAALAADRYHPPVGRLRHSEPAVSTVPALVRAPAAIIRAGAAGTAMVRRGWHGTGVGADHPRRLGQQQLRGGSLHRLSHLPRPVVAADGLFPRLRPDPPRHRPQL